MPVTVKLSRKFYEKVGDDVANELVELVNTVDTAYRADLRELNELNFARFDAKVDQRMAESDAKWERRWAESDAKWERRMSDLDARWEHRQPEWDRRVADLRTEIREIKAELIKWTFVFVAGGTLTVLTVSVAILKAVS